MHLGSLYTALASFLDARQHQGAWLLRIDDLDTPRNQPGASDAILRCLDHFGLHWDGEVDYQSAHLDEYQAAVEALQRQDQLYPCYCSRKQLLEYPAIYPGFCRDQAKTVNQPHALRLRTTDSTMSFNDRLQGPIHSHLGREHGDFVIKRKDNIYAYQLAVVIDDHRQQVNQVVRGFDLLDSTPKQLYLQQLLGYPSPAYLHIPVIVDQSGNKLSKQTRAEAVAQTRPAQVLLQLLNMLKQQPPPALAAASVAEILQWAIVHWQPASLQQQSAVTVS